MNVPDRKDFPKMWVWNTDYENRYKAIVLFVNNSGACKIVDINCEDSFLNGESFGLCYGDHCEPIEESKWRAFKAGEMPAWYTTCLFRYKAENSRLVFPGEGFDPQGEIQLQINGRWHLNTVVFNERECLIDGEWLPVGVRESDDEKV